MLCWNLTNVMKKIFTPIYLIDLSENLEFRTKNTQGLRSFSFLVNFSPKPIHLQTLRQTNFRSHLQGATVPFVCFYDSPDRHRHWDSTRNEGKKHCTQASPHKSFALRRRTSKFVFFCYTFSYTNLTQKTAVCVWVGALVRERRSWWWTEGKGESNTPWRRRKKITPEKRRKEEKEKWRT